MPHAYRWTGPSIAPRPSVPGRARRRAWRRRSRRAQVSAVATILGLLLVVTFIANYIATTLPNTMGQNDLQHELQVENQVSELSALVQAVAGANAIGAQVSEPITLGSLGAPPFANPDGGYIAPLSTLANTSGNYPLSTFTFTLSGQTHALTSSGTSGFAVYLMNTYAPRGEVSFDQGAVVFAEAGSFPIFIVPPSVTLSQGVLTVFLPWFLNPVTGESGNGGADLLMKLVSTSSVTTPSPGLSLASGSNIVISFVTPYAVSWYTYFQSVKTLASYVTCSGPNSVCSASYSSGGLRPLGTVTLTIPASVVSSLNAETAVFAVSLA